VTSFYGNDEFKLLADFSELLETRTNHPFRMLCAHNGKEFDFPYLCRRMLIHRIKLPLLLNIAGKKPWEVAHLDTMELWKFGDYKHYTSLDLLAAIFNIPSSKGEIDGSQVNEVYYKEKNIKKIADYCQRDVIAVAQLYLKMKGLGIIPTQHIIS
jgi:DNA polymerase elongation subunit (family B)